MRHDYGELLPKTSRARTIYLREPARARRESGGADRAGAHDALGIVPRLRRGAGRPQAAPRLGPAGAALRAGRLCRAAQRPPSREQGCARRATSTCIVSLCAPGVAHQWLVYSRAGHFSEIVSVARPATVTAYRLPFWHYTTPLVTKRGRGCGALGAAGDVPLRLRQPWAAVGRHESFCTLMEHLAFPQRKRGLPPGAQCLAGGGDGAAPPDRARRRPAPRPAAWAARSRRTTCSRATSRAGAKLSELFAPGKDTLADLQLHVRAGARAAVSRLHPFPRCGSTARRCTSRSASTSSSSPSRRCSACSTFAKRARLAAPAPAVDRRQHLRPRLLRRFDRARRRRCATSRSSSPARNGTCRS